MTRTAPQVSLLAGHFFRRLLENDLISPDGDAHESLSVVLAFLAVPGLWVVLLRLSTYASGIIPPSGLLVLSLDDKFQFMACSMIVMAFVTTLQWDALSLDARDYAVLGPLPIDQAVFLRAKLQALFLFVVVFAVAVNAIPILLFPVAVLSNLQVAAWRGLWLAAVQALCSIGAGAFGFFVVLAVRGALVNTLGPRHVRRVAVLVQAGAIVGLVTGFLLLPGLAPRLGRSAPLARRAALYLSPPAWFVGLHETLSGGVILADPNFGARSWRTWWRIEDEVRYHEVYVGSVPVFRELALVSVAGLVLAGGLGLTLYSVGQRRHIGRLHRIPEGGTPAVRRLGRVISWIATRTIVRDPIAQATFFFTLKTLARSARHRLYLAGFVAVGFALTVVTMTPIITREGVAALRAPTPTLLSIQLLLSFFLLVGVRAALAIPCELRANWLFRLVGSADPARSLAGARRAVQFGVAVPVAAAFTPVHFALWGPRLAALHFLSGTLVSLIFVEASLVGFRKLPFTCSYLSGKANVKVLWPLYLLVFFLCTYGFARIEAWAFEAPERSIGLLGSLGTLLAALVGWRSLRLRRRLPLVFEEVAEPATQALGLSG